MFLIVLLIISGLLAAFMNASPFLVKPGSRLENLKNSLETLTVPVGITCGVIALANAFNFWALHYPLLTWIAALVNSVILLKDFLIERLNIAEGPLMAILEFLFKYRVVAGISLICICIIHVILLLTPLFYSILL